MFYLSFVFQKILELMLSSALMIIYQNPLRCCALWISKTSPNHLNYYLQKLKLHFLVQEVDYRTMRNFVKRFSISELILLLDARLVFLLLPAIN